jgi:tetratricopeptide (TPR) repeat protein
MLSAVFDKKFLLALSLLFALLPAVMPLRAQTNEPKPDIEANQNEAITLFGRGQDAHESGDISTALKFYEEALKLFPEFPEAEYQRGSILLSNGKIAEAECAFRRAVELRPDWSLAMASLGALLVRNGQLTEAEKVLNEAVKLDAQNFPAVVALAELRLTSKAKPELLQSLLVQLRALTDGKVNAPAAIWAARGAVERALNQTDAAKKSLNQALSADPKNVNALFERAKLGARVGDFDNAQEDARRALQFSSNSNRIQAQLLLSQILAESGNEPEALKILDSLDEKSKLTPEAVSLRSTILVNGSTGIESIAALEALLEKDGKNVALLSRLCNLSRRANPGKALDYCRRASELEPANISHAVGFGAALVQAKQFAQAAQLFSKLLTIAPDNYTARANFAVSLYKLERFPEAIAEFKKLLEAKPDVAGTYFYLATAHDSLGEYVEASAAYQKFLQLADAKQNELEIDKVKLRLPFVAKQVEKGAGRKKKP